jgi:hypothetical protein
VVEKSEALARDHMAKREIRIRKERVRRLNKDDSPAQEDSAEHTQLETPQARVAKEAPEPSRTESDPQGIKKSRLPKAEKRNAIPSRVRNKGSRKNKAIDVDKTPKAPEKTPGPNPPGDVPGTLDWVAMELEELLRDMRALWTEVGASGRVSLLCTLGVLVGVFLPWVSDPAHPSRLGLFSGGILHVAISAAALILMLHQTKLARGVAPRLSKRESAARERRVALWQILLGGLSTLLAIGFLVRFGLENAPPQWPVRVRYGLYVTTFFGMGLAYGGFMFFHRLGRSPEKKQS